MGNEQWEVQEGMDIRETFLRPLSCYSSVKSHCCGRSQLGVEGEGLGGSQGASHCGACSVPTMLWGIGGEGELPRAPWDLAQF